MLKMLPKDYPMLRTSGRPWPMDKGPHYCIAVNMVCLSLSSLELVVNRKGSLSAFGRNFRFWLVSKHFGRISLSAERALTAKMLNFGRNTAILAEISLLFRQKETTFGRKMALSAETVLFRQFRLSAKIDDFGLPSFGFGRNSFGWPLPILPGQKKLGKMGHRHVCT